MSKRLYYCLVSAWIGALGLTGCSRDAKGDDPLGPERQMVVQLAKKTLSSPQPAVLNVAFPKAGAEGTTELSWAVGDGVSLVVRGPWAAFRAGKLDAQLVSGPLTERQVTANLHIDGKFVDSGRVSLSLGKGRVTGKSEEVGLNFNGLLVVSCSVPESVLKGHSEGSDQGAVHAPASASSLGEVLIDDQELRSSACAPLKVF